MATPYPPVNETLAATLHMCGALFHDLQDPSGDVILRHDTSLSSDSNGCDGLDGVYSVGLHVMALFVVLAASFIGTIIPLVGKHVPLLRLPPYVYSVGKCTATGVMLAVGLIHMVADASSKFNSSCVPEHFKNMYPAWAFLFAMIAAILMHALDAVIGEVSHSWMERQHAAKNAQAPTIALSDADDTPIDAPLGAAAGSDTAEERMPECGHPKCDDDDCLEGERAPATHELECAGHQHGVMLPADMVSPVQRIAAALCMEFGVTLHSVFVGLDLGVTANKEMKVLVCALVFHQMFEGLAMGSRLADATFKMSLEVVLMMVFSLSAPIGVAVATAAVSASKDALSGTTYVMVSGVLNSVCGGILVYLAFNLMFVDFPADLRRLCAPGTPNRSWKRFGMFAGLWFGAGIMGLIGKWC